jgi:thioredoxin reductase (NADPH)
MFMSKTCGPCRILKPILSRVLKEYEGRVHYVEIDIEEFPELTLQSSVAGTPTVQIYTGSELLTTLRGVKKSSEYKSEIEKALDA